MAGDGGEGTESSEGVVSPEDLDIRDEESVVEIEDGRYVIGTGNSPPAVSPGADSDSDASDATADDPGIDAEAVYEWLEADLDGATSQYGFDVTATFDGETAQYRLLSNDVVTTFEQLVRWYARQLDEDTAVEDALGILLLESSLTVRYPPEALIELLAAYDVSADDEVRDLVDAIHEGGMRFG